MMAMLTPGTLNCLNSAWTTAASDTRPVTATSRRATN
jgi:hypothetical protein